MTAKLTQGRRLINLLKKRGMTVGEMLDTKISTCPWKRVSGAIQEDEKLMKYKNDKGLIVYRVVNVYCAFYGSDHYRRRC